MDSKDYLQPDFDPKTLKVPQLRSLLVEYDIDYPSSAKKTELIEIFNREIKPKAKELLDQLETVIANSAGIINAASAVKDEASSPPLTKKKTAKKSKKTVENDENDDELAKKSTEKAPKKRLKKLKLPLSSSDVENDNNDYDDNEDTHFSKKNVFQRASMSPQSKKNTPVKLISDSEDSFSTPPKPIVPQKRNKRHEEDSKDEPEKKKTVVSPRAPRSPKSVKATPVKSKLKSKLDQQKFEEGPDDLFKLKSPKTSIAKSVDSGKVTKKKTTVKKLKAAASVVGTETKAKKGTKTPDVPAKSAPVVESDTSKVEEITRTPSSLSKLKSFVSESPEFAKQLGKKIISSPLIRSGSNAATPKGPKKQLGFVDELDDKTDVKMKIITTPSISDEEAELKKLQDEMSVHLEKTTNEVEKVQEDIETEEAAGKVENAFGLLFAKLLAGVTLLFTLIMALIFAIWYLDQKEKMGFCGYEVYERTFKVEDFEEFDLEGIFMNKFAPACSPCPENGSCGSYLQLSCDEGFLPSQPWYSIGGLLPIAPECVPDRAKQEKIEEMVNYALEVLRERNAKNCGKESDESVGLPIEEIHDLLKDLQDVPLPDEKYEELWVKVSEILKDEPEISVRQLRLTEDHNRQHLTSADNEDEEEEKQIEILRSISKSKFSLKCKFQEIIYLQLIRFRIPIISIITTVLVAVTAKYKYKSHVESKKQVDHLSSLIFKKLIQQNRVASNDNTGLTRDYLALVQLRDVLISDTNKNKSKLWEKVAKKVSKNSNIEERTIEIGGEIIKIWKWAGVDIDENELDLEKVSK